MPRFGGLIQFKDEMPENLPRAVASMRKLCDYVVGYDDASTDGSLAWAAQNLDHVFTSAENDWKAEIQHKWLMLEHLRKIGVDWVLWLDADEELSPPAVAAIQKLVAEQPDLTGITVPELNLWSKQTHYRIDRQFGDAGFLRLWRMRPELVYHDPYDRGLHRPQFPPAARDKMGGLKYPDEPIIHYSWDSDAKIVAKHARYAAQGQAGESLDRLAPDPSAVLVPVKPEWFWPKGG